MLLSSFLHIVFYNTFLFFIILGRLSYFYILFKHLHKIFVNGCCFIYSLFYCFRLSSFLFFISNVYDVCTFIINFLLIVSVWVYVQIYLIDLLIIIILLIFQYSILFLIFLISNYI